MKERRASEGVRKYFETATPEEMEKYAEALLSARSRVEPPSVPDSIIFASRWLSLLLAIFYAISVGWSEELLRAVAFLVLLGSVAWFPNEEGEATGRIGIGPAVSRPSNPWILFVSAWMFWLLFGLIAALEWVGAT